MKNNQIEINQLNSFAASLSEEKIYAKQMSATRQLKRLRSDLESKITPLRATFLHLVIIGLPVFWGFGPIWDSTIHPWMGSTLLRNVFPSASSIFNERILSEGRAFSSSLEAFSAHDMGLHFIYPYNLSFIVWFILRKSKEAMHFFHKELTMCSFTTILFMSILQCFHPNRPFAPFELNFFARMVLCHLVAIAISTWIMSLKRNVDIRLAPEIADVARWSIPGVALFLGSIAIALTVVASLQALIEDPGLEHYFGTEDDISQIVLTSFLLGVYHMAVHAFLLYRLRNDLMTVKQLKSLCLYELIANLCIPLFWLPEFDPALRVDQRITIGLRISLALVYGLGYYFAGSADCVGKIMAGEKAD